MESQSDLMMQPASSTQLTEHGGANGSASASAAVEATGRGANGSASASVAVEATGLGLLAIPVAICIALSAWATLFLA